MYIHWCWIAWHNLVRQPLSTPLICQLRVIWYGVFGMYHAINKLVRFTSIWPSASPRHHIYSGIWKTWTNLHTLDTTIGNNACNNIYNIYTFIMERRVIALISETLEEISFIGLGSILVVIWQRHAVMASYECTDCTETTMRINLCIYWYKIIRYTIRRLELLQVIVGIICWRPECRCYLISDWMTITSDDK